LTGAATARTFAPDLRESDVFPAGLGRPLVADPARLEQERARFLRHLERGGGATREAFSWLEEPERAAVFEGVLGSSPFLAECAVREAGFLGELAARGPEAMLEDLLAATVDLPGTDRSRLMAELRRIRRRVALLVALADLSGTFDHERTVVALTRFADAAVARAARFLLEEAVARSEIGDRALDPAESGIVLLAMGKQGAFELNYSSDIDLVVLFEERRLDYRGRETPLAFTVRFARGLVYILEQKTQEGYVFRTDLRLRPHLPGHPLALSCGEAELYYERHGQNWERAALIKARACAADTAAGEAFLDRLRPYIWRKYLDYAAIRDIHSIKRQIHAHRGFAEIRVPGHDLKVGRGGIREIEFFVQTQQLILGGRHPELRTRRTREALAALAAGRWIAPDARDELDRAYTFLRALEHRLQMVHDRQTQQLPARPEEFARFAAFAGYADPARLEADIGEALRTVERHYAALFEHEPDLGAGRRLVFTGTEDDPETLATLREMGFREPQVIAARIRSWHHGHIRATRSARARELLTELTPAILEALRREPDPDEAFRLFDEFVSNLPAGVQIFSLLHANPRLLQLLSDIVGAAPRLARHLSANVDLFESMLAPDFFEPLPDAATLAAELGRRLADARHFEEALDLCRRWAHGRQFQAGMHVLLGVSDVLATEACLTAIAEVVLEALLPRTGAWFEERHGRIEGGRFLVLGMGKLGSRELTIGSDLDLVFVCDAPPDARSDGPQPLPATTWYARFAQRLVAALTARTAEGRLYEIDMRLRPSGNVGPVACTFGSFARYQRETAQTWEHQALTRARPVAGDRSLAAEVEAVIDAVIRSPRDPVSLARDVRAMRERIFREHGTDDPWNLKHVRGGLVDLEFTAQYLTLAHAHAHAQLRTTRTRDVLEAAGRVGVLDAERAAELVESLDLQHALQAVLRLSTAPGFVPDRASPGVREALLRAANGVVGGLPLGSFEALGQRLHEAQACARRTFDELCPPLAEAGSGHPTEGGERR
jgi:glutamate-ammonia-ligase adenylyltransferase